MSERLPDLGLGIKGVGLQPAEDRNIGDRRELIREHRRAREKKRRAVYEPVSSTVTVICVIAILSS